MKEFGPRRGCVSLAPPLDLPMVNSVSCAPEKTTESQRQIKRYPPPTPVSNPGFPRGDSNPKGGGVPIDYLAIFF